MPHISSMVVPDATEDQLHSTSLRTAAAGTPQVKVIFGCKLTTPICEVTEQTCNF